MATDLDMSDMSDWDQNNKRSVHRSNKTTNKCQMSQNNEKSRNLEKRTLKIWISGVFCTGIFGSSNYEGCEKCAEHMLRIISSAFEKTITQNIHKMEWEKANVCLVMSHSKTSYEPQHCPLLLMVNVISFLLNID